MSADSCRHIAFTAPRNAELQAAAARQSAADVAHAKKAAAFDAMIFALRAAVPAMELAGFDVMSSDNSDALTLGRAALALAEEVAS